MWERHNRRYDLLDERNCADLIEGIRAQGGQEFPAIVRALPPASVHDWEVICGARRHWTVSWLRANGYTRFRFLVEVRELTDEEAFRLADIENRDRRDISDYERANDYAEACRFYYGGHQRPDGRAARGLKCLAQPLSRPRPPAGRGRPRLSSPADLRNSRPPAEAASGRGGGPGAGARGRAGHCRPAGGPQERGRGATAGRKGPRAADGMSADNAAGAKSTSFSWVRQQGSHGNVAPARRGFNTETGSRRSPRGSLSELSRSFSTTMSPMAPSVRLPSAD